MESKLIMGYDTFLAWPQKYIMNWIFIFFPTIFLIIFCELIVDMSLFFKKHLHI